MGPLAAILTIICTADFMTLRSALKLLLGLAIGLPLVQTLLFWVAGLLRAMGDEAAATFLGRVNVVAAVLWLASLVALVVLLSLKAIDQPSAPQDEFEEPPL
jgi:hypothetical protein